MVSNAEVAGAVVSLWRYPVKSMLGEELNATEVTERGLLGDRAYALVDAADGKVVSAKNPRKWSVLFDCRAIYLEPPRRDHPGPVRITLPDGKMVTSAAADLGAIFSATLGREVVFQVQAPEQPQLDEYWPDIDGLAHRETVTVEAMPSGTFFDFATVHLLTTATLQHLHALYPEGRFEARRFRPNLVIETGDGEPGFIENAWVGRTLAIGAQVRLRVTDRCGRCVMTTLAQGDLPKDPGVLRTAARHNGAAVGVYATVVQGGTVRRGDPVRLE